MNRKDEDIVQKFDIVNGLRELGISKGDNTLVHSSLSHFGKVIGGANTVIEALMDVTGEEGGILMPSFPAFTKGEYGLVENNEVVFDVRTSPSAMGKITDMFWRRSGVVRSIHPTHPVAAWGKRSRSMIQGHEKCLSSCGDNSPFHKNCLDGGIILLMGVTHACNTTLHTIEDINHAPTRSSIVYNPKVIDYEGREITVPTRPHFSGLPRRYAIMDAICKKKGIQSEVKVGNAVLRLIRADKLLEAGSKLIKKNPLFLIDMEKMK